MAGLLADVFSYGNTLKRKVNGLLADPKGTLEQFVGQLGDDTTTNINNQAIGYGIGGAKSTNPAEVAAARKALADYGAQSGMAAATVWHGSPHKFDKFDSSKIGTGEGAQAYGHGLYLAESPDVAKSYTGAGGVSKASETMLRGRAEKVLKNPDLHAASDVEWAGKTLEQLNSRAGDQLYKVDLPDEHIAKMLDWDKPLSQQHPDVQAALASTKNKQLRAVVDYANTPYSNAALDGEVKTMGEAIKLLGMNTSPAKGSAMLAKQGIPGIRYLDGGSRGTGQGSSNFVVFPGNEGLLNILERNGQPIKKPFVYPQEQALATAQKNAALPIEQGGLGLHPNNTPLERAQAMGFDAESPMFHGSKKEFDAFNPSRNGIYFTDSPELAKQYGKKVKEVILNKGNAKEFDAAGNSFSDADTYRFLNDNVRRLRGDSSVVMKNFMDAPNPALDAPISTVVAVNNPSQIRSRFAAFDPMRRNSPDILAGMLPLSALADEENRNQLRGLLGK